MTELPELPFGVNLSAFAHDSGNKQIDIWGGNAIDIWSGKATYLMLYAGAKEWRIRCDASGDVCAFTEALYAALCNGATYEDVVKFYDPIPF